MRIVESRERFFHSLFKNYEGRDVTKKINSFFPFFLSHIKFENLIQSILQNLMDDYWHDFKHFLISRFACNQKTVEQERGEEILRTAVDPEGG